MKPADPEGAGFATFREPLGNDLKSGDISYGTACQGRQIAEQYKTYPRIGGILPPVGGRMPIR